MKDLELIELKPFKYKWHKLRLQCYIGLDIDEDKNERWIVSVMLPELDIMVQIPLYPQYLNNAPEYNHLNTDKDINRFVANFFTMQLIENINKDKQWRRKVLKVKINTLKNNISMWVRRVLTTFGMMK